MNDTAVPEAQDQQAGRSVKRTGWLLAALILGSMSWYLVADRYTPYTNQARVLGYVIGVAPEVAGNITQVWVGNNQDVERGEKLFEVDPSKYRIALSRAESDRANARSQVDAGNAAVVSARANREAALAGQLRADQDYQRLSRLRKDDPGTISQRRLESSKASLDQARAKVSAADSEIQRAIEQKGGDDDASNAILLGAQSAVAKARLDLANTLVTAPSRGLITDMRADIGQYAGTGKAVMTLIAIHDLWISAEYTENNLGNLQAGADAAIIFDALPGRVYPGKVRSVGLGVSAGSTPEPGTLPSLSNDRDWLRQAQRFPVEIGFEVGEDTHKQRQLREQLRIGGQASVIVYSEKAWFTRLLGRAYMRLMSWLSYAY
ncbi:MAG: multidrug resistance efflux pump [Halieaceae bacterium]|jgi:multidrug resistance efflux pump